MMKLADFLEQRRKRELDLPRLRVLCCNCRQPDFACYCAQVEKFDPHLQFAILIHPVESRRRIATGRMSHLCLRNSMLIQGHQYQDNPLVNSILNDPHFYPLLLYPGIRSKNLSLLNPNERKSLIPPDKKPIIFVLDGTWNTARKTIHLSRNLQSIPRICFSPPSPSRFRVRKQPHENCYSTIEAIHHTIELLGPSQGFNLQLAQHQKLMKVFDYVVEQQLKFVTVPRIRRRTRNAASRLELMK